MSTPAIRALALFDDYITLAPPLRADALAALARDDPDTHLVLRRLLASDAALDADEQPDLLEQIPDALMAAEARLPSPPDVRLGQRLGPWRLERIIGLGGMGTVYEAQRADGHYRQRVALKCIRRELSSPPLVAGFLHERATLARLDHPGIAALIDGGVDDDGNPWFAMRYVAGEPIDTWCDRHRADLRRRVVLLVQVCDALAYAHARQVLHQDIKPSNLMVTHDGQVQLLDFGLTASLTDPGGLPRLAMSQGYTAPEALSSAPPQATADIWSLGRLMYSLLGGALPRTRSPLHLLPDAAPPYDPASLPMSSLAAGASTEVARARGARSATLLSRQLAGDLDAIALRATAARPGARYPSVAALRADLQAWLQQRPVQARAGGRWYRLARALRRQRAAAVVALVCLTTLAVGGSVALWRHQRLASEAAETRALSQVFEQTLGTATLSGLGATPMSSQQLLSDAEHRMRSLDLRDHPDVRARGLAVLARNHMALGDYARATALAREAGALQGDDPASTAALLAALLNLQGRPAEAGRIARNALAEVDDSTPANVQLQLLAEQARSQWHLVQHDDAQRTLGRALALAERVQDTTAQAELRTLRGQWSMRQTRFAEADADLQAAIRLAGDRAPRVASAARFVAAHNVMVQGRLDEGRAALTHLLADDRQQLGDAHPLVGRAWRLLAHVNCSMEAFDACRIAADRAEAIVRRDYGEQHPEYADVLRVRALPALFEPGSRVDGMALLRRSLAILRSRYPADHDEVQRVESMLALGLLKRPAATADARRRQVEDAIHLLETTLSQSRRNRLPLPAAHRIVLAEALMERDRPGDLAQARRLLDENTVLLRAYGPDFIWRFRNQRLDARLALRTGDLDRADAVLSTLLASLSSRQTSDALRRSLRQALVLRADLALHRGDRAQARKWLQQALAHTLAAFGATHAESVRMRDTLATFDRTGKLPPDA